MLLNLTKSKEKISLVQKYIQRVDDNDVGIRRRHSADTSSDSRPHES